MASYPMSREGCTTNCVNGKLILSCPIAPAVERDLGLCNQARAADQLMRIANMQVKMEEDLAAAELRMNPPKKAPPARTNPAFVAAGMAGIAQARAKTAQMRRDAFSHVD
jgi:hypothetical protein